MKKFLVFISVAGLLFTGVNIAAYADGANSTAIGTDNLEIKQVASFLDDYNKYSNEHNANGLKKLYSTNYISGDGLKLDDVMKLIQDTWKNYPDIKFASTIKTIRVNNSYASVETVDTACANTGDKSTITDDIGVLKNESQNILYLQKFGKIWKIISDETLYEKTVVKYGSAKNLTLNFHAPEQVNAGEDYTASLTAEIPNGMVALGSITKEPIVYPDNKPDEVFRQVSGDTGTLERVMKANTTNNNELAVASIGYTEMIEDINANSEIKLTGMALLMQRVNVIPKSTYVPDVKKNNSNDESEIDSGATSSDSDNNDDK